MLKFFFILISFCGIFIISCNDQRYTDKGIEEIVNRTDSLLEDLAGQKYEWASKSAYSTLMTYYPASDLTFINENYKGRSYSEAVNFYYFKDRTLARFISRLLKYYRNENGKIVKDHIRLTINFDPDGDVISYEKFVNNNQEELTSEDIDNTLSHSAELYKIVGDQE